MLFLSACGENDNGNLSASFGATVSPTPTPAPRTEELRVRSLTLSSISFDKGDYVWIIARGEIKVGPFIGYVDPDGNDSWMLRGYSIVPDAPHGGLLCRLKGQTSWTFCGSDTEFQPDEAGQIEFQINDDQQGNNDPDDYFQVGIIVASYSVRDTYVKETTNGQQNTQQSSDTTTSDYVPSVPTVPPPMNSWDCGKPGVSSAYPSECSIILDRENWERQQAEERQYAP
jgi:hypothetical protein